MLEPPDDIEESEEPDMLGDGVAPADIEESMPPVELAPDIVMPELSVAPAVGAAVGLAGLLLRPAPRVGLAAAEATPYRVPYWL